MPAAPHPFPPDVLENLVEAIPRLVRSKQQVLNFFTNAGVPAKLILDWQSAVDANRKSVTKFEMVRDILERLCRHGDMYLGELRQVLKLVVEWHEFSGSWETDAVKARGHVARLRELVGHKDTVTQVKQAAEAQEIQLRRARESDSRAKAEKEARLAEIDKRFARCFVLDNPQRRGEVFEAVANDYFREEGIQVSEPFSVFTRGGTKVFEQIDGAVEVGGHLFLVEIKWWSTAIDQKEAGAFCHKVLTRPNCGGIFMVNPHLSPGAVESLELGLKSAATFTSLTLHELYTCLRERASLIDLLRGKITKARLYREVR